MKGYSPPVRLVHLIVVFSFSSVLLLAHLGAATPDVFWLKTAPGSGADVGAGVAVDSNGNSFAVGYFNSTNVLFGSVLLTNVAPNLNDIFITKFDANGAVVWAKRLGGKDDDRTRAVAVDGQGNCFVTGSFASTNFTIEGIPLTNSLPVGNPAIFVAKYTGAGQLLWAKGADHGSGQTGMAIAVDPSGNSFVAAYTSGTNTFNGTNFVSQGPFDVLLLKYDSNGNLLWFRTAGGTGSDSGSAVATDAAGNVYLGANVSSTNANFSGITLTNGTTTNPDIAVAKYDSNGTILWAKRFGGSGLDNVSGLRLDPSGNCLITGSFTSTNLSFGDITLTNDPGPPYHDPFIAKLNGNGDALWARSAHGDNIDWSSALATDFKGNSYIAGYFQSPELTFETITLTNSESELSPAADAYAAKFDGDGNLIWVLQVLGINEQRAFGITVDPLANAYVTGWTQGTNVTFGEFATTNSYLDVFLIKIGSDYPPLQIDKLVSSAVVSWPSRYTGFNLQSSTDFQTWAAVPNPVITLNGRNFVTNTIAGSARFLRLKK